MNRRVRFWILWFVGNAVWLTLIPYLFSIWISHEAELEVLSGERSPDGDTVMIPIMGFVFINTFFICITNIVFIVYTLFKKARTGAGE